MMPPAASPTTAASASEANEAATMIQHVASETATFCADRTVQILGGDGLTKEYGRAEQIYRDAGPYYEKLDAYTAEFAAAASNIG